MTPLTLIIGNKAYSSWSLRAWLLLRQTGAAFQEVVIPLDRPETAARIREYSSSGRVPCLHDGETVVWDSLAIAEYLNERFPDAGLWPGEPRARAAARSVVAEMHAGFATLRQRLPMDLKRPSAPIGRAAAGGDLSRDIARIVAIWEHCRSDFGAAGPYLFGAFGAADAFYAPVVTRFTTYGIALPPTAAAYRDASLATADMREWTAAAKAEPWTIAAP